MLGLGLGVPQLAGRRSRPTDKLRALIDSLYGNGEQGAMYIPQPQVLGHQVLWQDVEGTVPVTADGDPVGLMLDLSPNGNHAAQSTSSERPVYRTDGVLHWLEFDGVDDSLTSSSIDVSGADTFVSCALERFSDTVNLPALSFGQGLSPSDGFVLFTTYVNVSGNICYRLLNKSEFAPVGNEGNRLSVLTGLSRTDTEKMAIRFNGLEVEQATIPSGGLAPNTLRLFSRTTGGLLPGRMFGAIFTGGSVVQSPAEAENYLAKLAGITL